MKNASLYSESKKILVFREVQLEKIVCWRAEGTNLLSLCHRVVIIKKLDIRVENGKL